MELSVDPPDLVVTLTAGPMDFDVRYPLDEVLSLDGGDYSIVEATETGVVIEDGEGDTEHIDLRELEA